MENRPIAQDRRIFLKNSLFASAFLGLGPSAYSFLGTKGAQDAVTYRQRFTPVSIIWDVANLIMKDKNKSWKMMDSISERFNMMFSGSILKKNPQYLSAILTEIKEGNGWNEEIHPKVALFCGFLAHREVERSLGDSTDVPSSDVQNASQKSLYRDCAILKYRINRETTGSEANLPSSAEIADFLKLLYHRATFRTHTLTPDTADWERWIVDYIDWYHEDRKYLEKLAEIYLDDDKKFQRNKAGTSFFDPEDELVRIANDYSVREIELSSSFVNNAKGNSLYAKTLAKAVLAVKSLDEFFEGKLGKEEFMEMNDL